MSPSQKKLILKLLPITDVLLAPLPTIDMMTPQALQMSEMKRWLQRFGANAGVLGEFMVFLWKQKLWWLIPMVATLLLCGLLLIFASSTGLGPFIYSLF